MSSVAESLKVGPSRFSQGGEVVFHKYESGGGFAIQVYGEDGLQYTATVNLAGKNPGQYGVWLKDWSENEGVVDALVKAGVVELTGETAQAGFAVAKHAVLTERARRIADDMAY